MAPKPALWFGPRCGVRPHARLPTRSAAVSGMNWRHLRPTAAWHVAGTCSAGNPASSASAPASKPPPPDRDAGSRIRRHATFRLPEFRNRDRETASRSGQTHPPELNGGGAGRRRWRGNDTPRSMSLRTRSAHHQQGDRHNRGSHPDGQCRKEPRGLTGNDRLADLRRHSEQRFEVCKTDR